MYRIMIGLFVIASSFNVFAQNQMEGIFPSLKKVNDESEYKPHMGLTAGVNSPRGESNSTAETGVNIGFQPYIPFDLGFEMSTSRFNQDDDETYKRVTALARATYNFGGTIPVLRDSYVGGAAGPVFLSGSTEFGGAPLVGFDIPLSDKAKDYLTLGLNSKYLMVTDAPNSLITNAAVSYWF